jgi:perosamine synthetase
LCFQKEQRFVHETLGWNYRMTNLQAALGLAQLEQLNKFVEKKRKMGALYNHLLKDIEGLQLPLEKTDFARNIYWVYGIVLKNEYSFNAITVMKKLGKNGIGTRPFFYPLHLQPVLIKRGLFKGEEYPVAERISRRGFYIPSGLALNNSEIEKITKVLKKILYENN